MLGLLGLLGSEPARADLTFDPPVFQGGQPDSHGISAATLGNDGAVWMIGNDSDRLLRYEGGVLVDVAPVSPAIPGGDPQFVQLEDGPFALAKPGAVWTFASDGTVLSEFHGSFQEAAISRDGRVYTIQSSVPDDRIDVYDVGGTLLDSWPLLGTWAYHIAVGPDGRVFALVGSEGTADLDVQVYSSTGEELDRWPGVGRWCDSALLVMPSGTVWLLPGDTCSEPIRMFSPEGILLCAWPFFDPEQEWVSEPYRATEDAAGNLICLAGYHPAHIDTFAPLGPGALIVPDADDVPYVVDGASLTGPQRFLWNPGTVHSLSVAPSTPISPVTRRDFVSWGGAGDVDYDFTVPAAGRGLRLNLQSYHWIDTVVDSGGTGTPSLWAPEGQPLTLTAEPDSGYSVVKWGHPDSTGWQPFDVLEPEWTHVIEGPERWEACIAPAGLIFTISASDSDPWVNAAPPTMGPRQLFLWAVNLDHGISAMEADAVGSLVQFPFVPEGSILNLGGGANLLCGIPGCPVGAAVNLRMGSWWVVDNGGDFCLVPSAANDVLGAVDCPRDFPELLPIGVVGFSSIGEPCLAGTMETQDTKPSDVPEVNGLAVPHVALIARGSPFRRSVDLDVELPGEGRARIRIFDVAGRLVRELWSGPLPAGARTFTWDGRTDGGQPMPPGIYFARLDAADGPQTTKLVRIDR